ncbi:MAG: M15 family metallopeptidase [Porphyromonas sp.]|nr:M15 family metallopeptidase [Porphyromonas sp.]
MSRSRHDISVTKRARRVYLLGSLLFSLVSPAVAQSMARQMEQVGLIDVHTEVPAIVVDLMYARADNFVGEPLYPPDFRSAYLLPHMVRKLARAQEILRRELGPQYRLIIYDAARPLSVQHRMFQKVSGTPHAAYVSSGRSGRGRHNYGAAVDLSIIDIYSGTPLDMGSPVDHFGVEAHLTAGPKTIGATAYRNRQYLIALMAQVGLRPIKKEWWHFQEPESIDEVRRKYILLDF